MTFRKKFFQRLFIFSFQLLLSARIAAAAVPVESSHSNSNTYANLNTITSTGPITFTIAYDSAGDIKWYKDNVLVQTDVSVTSATFTTAWTSSDCGQMKQMMVNSINVDGISVDTVWNVEVQQTGTATIAKHTHYPQPRIDGTDTLYIANGWTNLPSLYLVSRQEDNAWMEYVNAKTYIIRKSIYVDGSALYIDSATARNVYIQGLPAADSNYIVKIREKNNGTISIDKVSFYGWNSGTAQELTATNGSPVIASDGNNRLDIKNSNFRHVQIHYNADKSPGDIVDNNTFYEGANQNIWVLSADPPDGSQGQIISNNAFIYGKETNYCADRSKDTSGMVLRNNKFSALPWTTTAGNVGLGQKTSFIGNELSYSCYNMIELPEGTFTKYNNLHDNGGHHNGFNGMGTLSALPEKYTYFVNDYCHDFTGYSGWYVNVVTYNSPDPADWDIADHAYVINGYAKDMPTGLGLLGLYDSYFYNYNSDNAGNVIQYGTDHLVFRRSHFFNSSQTALMFQDVNPKSGFGYVENIYVIDSEFSHTNTDDYRLWSNPEDGGNPIVHSINSYRRKSDNSIQIPAVNIMGSAWKGEVRNYAWLDVLVQDQNGNPVPNAVVTIEALTDPSLPAVKINLPPPPDDLVQFPEEYLPIPDMQNFNSITTGINGHTPPPNYGFSPNVEATPALLFMKQTRGVSTIIVAKNYTYRVTATNGAQTVYKDITPDAAWLREDPVQPAKTVVLTFDKPAGKYALQVNGGTGSGLYSSGQSVNIAAGIAPSGKVFDKWIGDTTTVNEVNSASTFIVVPSSDVSVTAYYKAITYHLTVAGGTGSGDYPAGKIVVVDASTSSATQVFYKWTGDTEHVVSPGVYSSTLIMPAHDVTVSAAYRNPTSYSCHLTVADGQGTDFYAPGDNVAISAPSSPFSDMLFDHWEGDTANLADAGANNTTLAAMPDSYLIVYPVYRASGLPSNNAYLSQLAVSGGSLYPRFTSGTTGYSVRVGTGVTSVTVTPTASKGASAAITVNGTPVNSGSSSGAINLNGGSTAITVHVTAPDGITTRTYAITVIRVSATDATGYTLSAPSPASGEVGATSGNFTITPNGKFTGIITITPAGGGLSTPLNFTFSNSSAPCSFTITPTAAGTVTLTPTNNGGLVDPANVTYTAYVPGTLCNSSWNYPNPVNFTKTDRTTIAYTVAGECNVYICLYSLAGDLVKVLVDNKTTVPGRYYIDWYGDNDGGDKASSGVYLYVAKIGNDVIRKKIVLLR